jgi:hypothetical protein
MAGRLVGSFAAALALMMFVPTAGAVGVGKACGGFPGLQCDGGLFCQQKPGTCKVIDMSGICTRVPRICPKVNPRHVMQVCGCNNVTYNNDCERQQAMVSLAHKGACK